MMRDVIVVAIIVGLFAANLAMTFQWWQLHHDLRAVRGVVAAVGLFLGAVALGIATWALHSNGQEELVRTVSLLVNFGQGVLLTVGSALLYIAIRERRVAA